MSKKTSQILWITAVLALTIGLLPPTQSLADLTGEEARLAQLRGLMQWAYTAVRPQPKLAPQAVMHHADVPARGVNTFLDLEVLPEVRAQSLQMAYDAGFRFIRQPFPWADIEIHAKGNFIDKRNDPNGVDAWAKYDNIVALAEAQGIEIIARLGKPPAWSRAEPPEVTGDFAPPNDYADYGDFVAAVAERYADELTYYQIWNEPNGNEEWGIHQPVSAEQYTDLLCLAHDRIKQADPDAVILAGALTPTVSLDGQNLNDLVFLQRMYQAGAGACFDILSAQGYGLWSGAMDHRLRPTVINYPHHLYLRDMMVANGEAEKSLWISEIGWNVAPEGVPPVFGRVTPARQAQYALQAYERIEQEWPWIGVGNYWFLKRATDWETAEPFYYFRLLEPDFKPLPVYAALVAGKDVEQEGVGQPMWRFWWQEIRPWLILYGGATLFFLWLYASRPPQET